MHPRATAAIATLTTAAAATSASTTFTIDPNQSDVTVTFSAIGLSDGDNAPVSGTIDIQLNPDTNTFNTATLEHFNVAADEPLDFSISDFLGSFTATATGLAVTFPDGESPVGPANINPAGDATFNDVPADLDAAFNYNATGAICAGLAAAGLACNDVINAEDIDGGLLTIEQIDINVTRNPPPDDNTLTLTGSFNLTLLFDPLNPAAGQVDVSTNITATADTTTPFACPGNTDGDASVNAADLLAVLNNLGNAVPIGTNGDVAPPPAGDGLVTAVDLLTVLGNFGNTCPTT